MSLQVKKGKDPIPTSNVPVIDEPKIDDFYVEYHPHSKRPTTLLEFVLQVHTPSRLS